MSRSLVIVESPAKAKTINHYLGSAYIVKASMGHVRDLPKSKMGVDVEHDFAPTYQVIPDKKKVVAELKKLAEGSERIILAADNDREGEAISWHLRELIGARRLPFLEDRVYKPADADRLFADVAHHLSFIPGVVIRRDVWLSRDRTPYYGSLFVHVGVIFRDRLPGDALVVARPLVAVRNANVSWAARSFEIWMLKWPELIWSFRDFPDEVKATVCPREPWRGLKALLTHRAMGSYSLVEYRRWIAPRAASRGRKTIAWAVAAAPGHLVNMLSLLYCVTFYGQNRIPRFNLSNSRFSVIAHLKKFTG